LWWAFCFVSDTLEIECASGTDAGWRALNKQRLRAVCSPERHSLASECAACKANSHFNDTLAVSFLFVVSRVPMVRMLPEPSKRVRWLTRNEADGLIAELPPHLADMVRFSLETGLRRANVTGLQWSQVDLVRRTAWIHPDQAKARKAIPVPLSNVAVLTLRKQIGKHQATCSPSKANQCIR